MSHITLQANFISHKNGKRKLPHALTKQRPLRSRYSKTRRKSPC